MARIKPKNMHPVRTVDDAGETLAEIGQIKRILKDLEIRLNEDISALKAEASEEAAPLRSRLEALENGLATFADSRKSELFKDRRSLVLDYGTLGWRRSSELAPIKGSTWKTILGRLKDLAFSDVIRIKEAPDREAMATWPDERLELVGCQRLEKDTFWYELDEAKLAERA